MSNLETSFTIKLTRTLWFNTYRGKVSDVTGNYVATLSLIPTTPLDRSEVPPDAPEAAPYITAIVEDGQLEADDLVEFESHVADLLLCQMAQPDFKPEYCQFAYPSPPYLMGELPGTE
jgi:hypothetical protein